MQEASGGAVSDGDQVNYCLLNLECSFSLCTISEEKVDSLSKD